MKTQYWSIALILLLAGCQQPPTSATTILPTNTAAAVATNTQSAGVTAPATLISIAATGTPAIHKSSQNPKAPNLIVVRDQPVVNASVTIDLVRAAQPGWLALYLSKNDKPGHHIGYVAVQAGETKQLNIPLDPKSGISISEAYLAGKQLFAVLQSGSKAPGAPVEVNGRSVLEPFTVLLINP